MEVEDGSWLDWGLRRIFRSIMALRAELERNGTSTRA